MAAPNIEGTVNAAVFDGGAMGTILGDTATEEVGLHGKAVVQTTGFGTPVGNVKLASFNAGSNAAPANATVVAQAVAQLYVELIAKGIIGA